MRLLDRLRDHAPGRNLHQLAVIFKDFFGPRFYDNFGGLQDLFASALVIDAEAVEFLDGRGSAQAKFNPAVADDIEHGSLFRHLNRMVELKRQQADAVSDANIFRTLADGAKEHFGRRTMRIFLQKVMLDLPHEIEAEPIAEFDLLQRLPVDIVFTAVVPRPGHLHFKMQTEFHNSSVTSI